MKKPGLSPIAFGEGEPGFFVLPRGGIQINMKSQRRFDK